MEDKPSRSLPPAYSPSLVFSHGKNYREQIFCTLSDQGYCVRSVPELRNMSCVASCQGWLLLQSYSSTECYLLNPDLLTKINLPPLKYSEFLVAGLTSTPTDPNCFVVFIDKKKESVISCRVGGTKWINHEVRLENQEIGKNLRTASNAVGCNGKLYFSSDYAMVVLDVGHTGASMKLYKWTYLSKSLPGNECHTDFLVESCGEIFMVVAIHFRELVKVVRKCDVHRLDFSTMDWMRVDESLGDRIFLLGETSTASFSTTGSGMKGNCIYLTLPESPLMYVSDLDDGTVTTRLACPKEYPYWSEPFWLVPNCMLQVIPPCFQARKDMQKFGNPISEEEGWKDLPLDLLQLILSSLALGDCIRFHLTCKTWMLVTSSLRSNPPLTGSALPWLMTLPDIKKGVCNFYHPIYRDAYSVKIPELEGAYIHEAKQGWLLVSQGDSYLFFFNPLTRETINLPHLQFPHDFAGITFSCPPTSPDCLVLGHDRSRSDCGPMLFYPVSDNKEKGDKADWYDHYNDFTEEYEFMAADSNPVFSGGVFYVLSKDGILGIFNPHEEEEDRIWQVLPVSPIFTYKTDDDFQTSIRCFLLECDGEILSVFVDYKSTPIWIYKLEKSEKDMKWMRLESLGDKVLFLSPARSALFTSGIKGIEDRIYFSLFPEKINVYYSLVTRRYHCLECVHCGGSCTSFCEPTNCTWIQFPN